MRILFAIVIMGSAACSSTATPLPKGPPPEYEQDPVTSDAPADAAVAKTEAK